MYTEQNNQPVHCTIYSRYTQIDFRDTRQHLIGKHILRLEYARLHIQMIWYLVQHSIWIRASKTHIQLGHEIEPTPNVVLKY